MGGERFCFAFPLFTECLQTLCSQNITKLCSQKDLWHMNTFIIYWLFVTEMCDMFWGKSSFILSFMSQLLIWDGVLLFGEVICFASVLNGIFFLIIFFNCINLELLTCHFSELVPFLPFELLGIDTNKMSKTSFISDYSILWSAEYSLLFKNQKSWGYL